MGNAEILKFDINDGSASVGKSDFGSNSLSTNKNWEHYGL
jgi:hypothetical protein